jgi:hypothetical protein
MGPGGNIGRSQNTTPASPAPSATERRPPIDATALVRKFSKLLGIAEPTIVLHDRNLVVAGLRSKSGRGNSAARMTARDAAHLLVAVLGSSHVKDSAETVRRYKETSFHKSASGGYDDSTIAALRNLPPDHSFVDAIEALIAAAADGSLELYVNVSEVEGEKIGYEAMIEITVQTPGLLGDISIRGGDASGHGRYGLPNPYDQHQSLHPPTEEVDAWKQKVNDYYVESDLTQYRHVTAKTILELGQILCT